MVAINEAHEELPVDVQRWRKQAVRVKEDQENVEGLISGLGTSNIALRVLDEACKSLAVMQRSVSICEP
jgi:predicted component of type VI protein secretion system